MAIKKPATQVDKAPTAVASMNPDNMLAGGLKDDFDGEIVKARVVPWDYDGNIDHDILAVALTIQPDDEKDPFVQHYSCGELEHFMPSKDGESPVDTDGDGEALEGIYALRVGKKEQLNNNTNWAHFIGALIDAGFDKSKLVAAVTFAEGIYGHWNRIPQKKRSGIVVQAKQDEGKRARSNDILVLTELKEKPAGAKTAKAAATKPAAVKSEPTPAPAANNGDLDARLAAVVLEALANAGDSGLTKAKLPGLAIKAFQGAEKAKAVKRVSELDFLSQEDAGWVFDADSGVLVIG